MSRDPNTDRPGGDYSDRDLAEARVELCEQACLDDPRCLAYSYVKPGVFGPAAHCFLKASAPQARQDDRCTSGIKTEQASPVSGSVPSTGNGLVDALVGLATGHGAHAGRDQAVQELAGEAGRAANHIGSRSHGRHDGGDSPRATVSLEFGSQRGGVEYQAFDLSEARAEACQQACADDPRCQAYTYVRPGIASEKARCYLKDVAAPSMSNACCVSGAKETATLAAGGDMGSPLGGMPSDAWSSGGGTPNGGAPSGGMNGYPSGSGAGGMPAGMGTDPYAGRAGYGGGAGAGMNGGASTGGSGMGSGMGGMPGAGPTPPGVPAGSVGGYAPGGSSGGIGSGAGGMPSGSVAPNNGALGGSMNSYAPGSSGTGMGGGTPYGASTSRGTNDNTPVGGGAGAVPGRTPVPRVDWPERLQEGMNVVAVMGDRTTLSVRVEAGQVMGWFATDGAGRDLLVILRQRGEQCLACYGNGASEHCVEIPASECGQAVIRRARPPEASSRPRPPR